MISRDSLAPWLRRPVVLVLFAGVALAALLSGGLAVAHAVDGAPAADATSPSPAAGSNGGSNVAAGVNTTDGKTVYAIKLKIVQVASDTVAPTNTAVAINSGCTDCSTVAVAFEGVVVVGTPTDFQPTNLALAVNSNCSGCTAFADAYQQVVQTSTRVRVTKAGRREIASIRKDLDGLKHSNLTLDEIRTRVAADEQAFADVLRTQLVPVGHVADPAPSGAPILSDQPDAPTTATSPAVPATQDPSASASQQPTDSPGTGTGTSTSGPSSAGAPTGSPSPGPSSTDSPSPSATP